MKKIFTRILIAVAVAIILSKLKLLGVINVSALEVYTQEIQDLCYYNQNETLAGCPAISTSSTNFLSGTTFKGSYYATANTFGSIGFLVPRVNNLSNKTFYSSFIFLTTAPFHSQNVTGLTAFAKDGQGNISYCESSTNVSSSGASVSYVGFNCKIFQGSAGSVRIFINGPFTVLANGASFYISNVTYTYDNDIELAQQTANNHLQNLRNQLSSTNSKLDDILTAIQNQNQKQQETNNKLDEQNNFLKDDSSIGNDKITGITDIDTNTSNTAVSDFITLPITLLGKYKDGMSNSCTPVNFGSLLGTQLYLPCINIQSYLGNDLWSTIDMLCSLFMVYNIAMLCITIWEGITSLHDDFYGAYQPQHGVGGRVQRGEMEGLY